MEHAARINHHPRPIGRRLVPDRWQAKDWPRIAGAQSTDNYVVDLGGVLNDQHSVTLLARIAELCDGAGRVRQKARPVPWIRPRTRHHTGSVARADLVFVSINQRVECVAIHYA